MAATEITHISLCSGYGGIDLGLRRVLPNLRTIAYSEIEAFACELLLARMEGGQLDAAPIWSNLKSFPWTEFSGKVDVLSGGYPCQPFSAAGLRKGTDDPRHLWPFISAGIAVMQPSLCFFENVEGHITLGLSTVISDLEQMGYKVSWGIFSAAECGAPHQRKRVFILAHRNDTGLERYRRHVAEHDSQGRQGTDHAWPSRPSQPQHAWEPPRVMEHSNSYRRECNVSGDAAKQDSNGAHDGVSCEADSVGNANGAGSQEWTRQRGAGVHRVNSDGRTDAERLPLPTLGGDADGPASGLDYAELCITCDNRTDELRLLGNGVVPATAALAFLTLMQQISKWEEVQG